MPGFTTLADYQAISPEFAEYISLSMGYRPLETRSDISSDEEAILDEPNTPTEATSLLSYGRHEMNYAAVEGADLEKGFVDIALDGVDETEQLGRSAWCNHLTNTLNTILALEVLILILFVFALALNGLVEAPPAFWLYGFPSLCGVVTLLFVCAVAGYSLEMNLRLALYEAFAAVVGGAVGVGMLVLGAVAGYCLLEGRIV